jgi:septal ring factor EnvC (AmiA/AmiB activator)
MTIDLTMKTLLSVLGVALCGLLIADVVHDSRRLQRMETQLNEIRSTLTDIESDLSDLESDLSDLEADFSDLESDLSDSR